MDWDLLCTNVTRALASAWLPASERSLLRRIDPYDDWRAQNRLTRAAVTDLEAALIEHASCIPKISVVMPVHRPKRIYFDAALTSLKAQILTEWELCLCDDGSDDPMLTQELERLVRADARIKLTSLRDNRGISIATNAAAGLATGDVLLFMDQDDELAPDCLAEFGLAFAEDPALELAYSDSDKISETGDHFAPSFKPDWSPILLLSHMYLSHAIGMRRNLFERIGGLRSAFDGSQDFDLTLRACEHVGRVRHIARVLYHWRRLPGSTAISADEKPGSIVVGRNAVCEALDRRRINAEVVHPDWAERVNIGLFELRFAPFAGSLSVIVFDECGYPIDGDWLEWLLRDLPPTAQLILAASSGVASTLSSAAIDRCEFLDLVGGTHLAARLSVALSRVSGEMILLVRAGLKPANAGWLAQLCGYASLPNVGLVGARHLAASGKIANAGMIFPATADRIEPAFAGLGASHQGPLYLARTTRECIAVSAACLAFPQAVAARLGALPPGLDDCLSIGVALSREVHAIGASVISCASCDVCSDCAGPEQNAAPTKIEDPWYNSNLGRGKHQFVPTRRCPPLRSNLPVRVAAVTHNLDREGAQTTLLDLLVGLKESGLADPFVISPCDGGLGKAMQKAGIPVLIIPSPGRRAGGAKLAEYRARLVSAFVVGSAQAVLANTLESHAAITAASEAGIGSIWWQHEGGSWRHYFNALPRSVRARAYAAFAQCYRVVQVANATHVGWLPLATRDNFELIRHAIPPGQIAAELARWDRAKARKELDLKPTDCCILLLGSVSARKGQRDVIHALAGLPRDAGLDLRIFIVGELVDQAYRRRIEATLDRLRDGRRAQIKLLGAVPDSALYFSAADIFVCCSRQESAPRAIVEAMAFGLPVVSTPVDGIPELVRFGCNGLSFPVGDYQALGKLLVQLSASPADRQRLGRAGRELVPQVSDYESMIARFGALLREAARLRDNPALQID